MERYSRSTLIIIIVITSVELFMMEDSVSVRVKQPYNTADTYSRLDSGKVSEFYCASHREEEL